VLKLSAASGGRCRLSTRRQGIGTHFPWCSAGTSAVQGGDDLLADSLGDIHGDGVAGSRRRSGAKGAPTAAVAVVVSVPRFRAACAIGSICLACVCPFEATTRAVTKLLHRGVVMLALLAHRPHPAGPRAFDPRFTVLWVVPHKAAAPPDRSQPVDIAALMRSMLRQQGRHLYAEHSIDHAADSPSIVTSANDLPPPNENLWPLAGSVHRTR
jgi:hypothetical protein